MDDGLLDRYRSAAGATAYASKYEDSWLRRLSSRRELRLVRRCLDRAGAQDVLLDVPCAAGRLVPVLLERARRVTALDLSPAMVAVASEALAAEIASGAAVVGVGDAERLPFEDGAFDTVVSWRLLHHLTDRARRVRVLTELGRVARRAVVVSWNDAGTWKARFQRWRRRARRSQKLTRAELAAEAAEAGLALDAAWRLSSLFSLQAGTVLRKRGATSSPATAAE